MGQALVGGWWGGEGGDERLIGVSRLTRDRQKEEPIKAAINTNIPSASVKEPKLLLSSPTPKSNS